MLKPFQVNVGRYLSLDRDILPTAKVSELCEAVEAVSGEEPSNQVLFASDGRQMNFSEPIGAYSITESQPVFVFYRSHMLSPDPPNIPSLLPYRGDLQPHLELLKLKPAPGLFKKQVALARRLSEYSARVGQACGELSELYQLQCNGWRTVLNNCTSIIKLYQKHKTLFAKTVEGFHEAKPRFLKLLEVFPTHVKLLQRLPVPNEVLNEATPTSLYDWISTHDEKNSLQDLGAVCQRSLSKIEDDRIDSTLKLSDQILAGADSLLSEEDQFNEKISQFKSMADNAKVKVDTQLGLAKNIQSTSERALRSGDAGTVADLVVSHHKSLELMTSYCEQLEVAAQEMERSKIALTKHIHSKLKEVTQLQKRVANSNNQLVMLHEHVKLARKRFEILEQVCTAPDVLGKVISEVERRRLYISSLDKKMREVSTLLRRAKDEEKLQRRAFTDSYGLHFVLTLFPELQDKVPSISVRLPESLSKSSISADNDLENIKCLLPENSRSTQSDLNCTSIKLLSTPLALSGIEQPVTELGLLPVDSTESPLSSSRATTSDIETQTDDETSLYVLETENLQKQLESLTREIHVNREHHAMEKEQIQAALSEEHAKSTQLMLQMKNDQEHYDKSLYVERNKCTALRLQVEHLQREKEELLSGESAKSAQLLEQIEKLKYEKDDLLQLLNLERIKTAQLLDEVEHLSKELKSSRCLEQVLAVEKANSLSQENRQLQLKIDELTTMSDDLNQKFEEIRVKNVQQNTHLEQQEIVIQQYSTEKENLQQCVLELTSTRDDTLSQLESIRTEHSKATEQYELKQKIHKERTEMLEEEIEQLREKLNMMQSEKDVLVRQANQIQDLANVSERLHNKELDIQRLNQELNHANSRLKSAVERFEEERSKLYKEKENLQSDLLQLKDVSISDKKLQETRYQQAQIAISSLKSHLEKAQQQIQNAENREKESKEKLVALQGEITSTNNNLVQQLAESERQCTKAEQRVVESQWKIESLEEKVIKCEKERIISLEQANLAERKLEALENDSKQVKSDQEKALNDKLTEIEKLKAECMDITSQRDSHLKHAMEVERELKELRRDLGVSPHGSLEIGESLPMPRKPLPPGPATPSSKIFITVSIGTLQVGDTALFINDQYGNYLALSVDSRTYYLNQTSVHQLEDIALKNQKLNLSRKILCGKLTNRVLVEVRKEDNRLHIPVGERLYKVDAVSTSFQF